MVLLFAFVSPLARGGVAVIGPDERALEDRREPWGLLDSFPEDIEFIAVLDQPSKQLLSGSGKAARSFVGSMGLFSKTRFAWRSLGEILETDADGVVEKLMSGRVVLMVDGLFDGNANPLNLMVTADTNWVVMAEVDDPTMALIRKKLKPVPRELVGGGIAVYGIEQGRYSMVMLNGDAHNKPRVILSPKGGRGLLERALQGINRGQRVVEPGALPVLTDAQDWSVAVRVRADRLFGSMLDSLTTKKNLGRGLFHVRGLIGGNEAGMELAIAMPYDEEVLHGRAPIEMLSAMDEQVICAGVTSSITKMNFDIVGGLSVLMRESNAIQTANQDRVLAPSGSLFVFTADDLNKLDDDGPLGLTILSVFDRDQIDAVSADALIEPMLNQSLPGGVGAGLGGLAMNPSSYSGQFPRAVRAHTVVDDDGVRTQVAWKASPRSETSELVISIGDDPIRAGDRVRMLDRASETLDAIGGSTKDSPVVFQGFLRLGELVRALNQVRWMGVGQVDESLGLVTWEIVQDRAALRGQLMFEKPVE